MFFGNGIDGIKEFSTSDKGSQKFSGFNSE